MLARIFASLAVLAATAAQADTAKPLVVYGALGGVQNGGDSFASGGPVLVDEVLNTDGVSLDSVSLTVKLGQTDLGSFRVVGYTVNSSGLPGPGTTIATVADKTLTPDKFTTIKILPDSSITLQPNTRYFVGIATAPGGKSSIILGNTVTPSVLSRPNVVAGGYYYNNGGLQSNSGGPYQVKVVVTKAP